MLDLRFTPRCLSFREHLILYDANELFVTIRRIVHGNMDDPDMDEA
jgi:hypothetical protein